MGHTFNQLLRSFHSLIDDGFFDSIIGLQCLIVGITVDTMVGFFYFLGTFWLDTKRKTDFNRFSKHFLLARSKILGLVVIPYGHIRGEFSHYW